MVGGSVKNFLFPNSRHKNVFYIKFKKWPWRPMRIWSHSRKLSITLTSILSKILSIPFWMASFSWFTIQGRCLKTWALGNPYKKKLQVGRTITSLKETTRLENISCNILRWRHVTSAVAPSSGTKNPLGCVLLHTFPFSSPL